MKKLIIIIIILVFPALSQAQTKKRLLREGNREYKSGKYEESEIRFRQSLEKADDYVKAKFNLGDALYKQGKYEEAASQFYELAKDEDLDPNLRARAYHNLGNVFMEKQDPKNGAASYINSLKLNPKDEETRYNLAYAQQLLRMPPPQQQQQNQKDQDDQNDEDKDKQKDQKQSGDQDKDKNKQNDQNQAQNQEGDEEKQNQKSQAQKREEEISKKEEENILRALQNHEKNLQEKLLRQQRRTNEEKEKKW